MRPSALPQPDNPIGVQFNRGADQAGFTVRFSPSMTVHGLGVTADWRSIGTKRAGSWGSRPASIVMWNSLLLLAPSTKRAEQKQARAHQRDRCWLGNVRYYCATGPRCNWIVHTRRWGA